MYNNLGKYFASSKSTEKPTKSTEASVFDHLAEFFASALGSNKKPIKSREESTKSLEPEEIAVESDRKYKDPLVTSLETDSGYCNALAGPGEIIFLILTTNFL